MATVEHFPLAPLAFPEQYLEPDLSTLHVAIVSESSLDHASGVTRSVIEVAQHLMAEGHKVTIICPGSAPDIFGDAEVIITKSANIQDFEIGRKSTKKFKKLFQTLDLDVVHIASPMRSPKKLGLFLGGNAIDAADELGIPITAVYQTDAVRFAGHLGLNLAASYVEQQIPRMHNKADLNLVPSSASLEDLINWHVDPETLRLWGRGVDTETFNTTRRQSEAVAELRERIAPNGETIIGLVSRLEPEKLIKKLEILKDIPDTKMVLVGKGSQRKKLQKLLGNSAFFTGRLNGEDLANAYAAIDVFPFPATSETFAQVIQEAKASSAVPVAANRGGPRDLIIHGQTGYLYEPAGKKEQDIELYYFVRKLVEDPALRSRMSELARASVENRTWDVLVREIVGYYHEAIDLRHLRAASAAKQFGQLALAA